MAALEKEGYAVRAVRVSSRKGLPGNEERVIRQRRTGDGEVELACSLFRTELRYQQ